MALLLWLACAISAVSAFNVDIPSRVIHRGKPNSMFGFTVQAHIDGGDKMILVGAPEDDPHRFSDVVKPGAVYRCSPYSTNDCSELIFDSTSNNRDRVQQRQIDQKSGQWLGATLHSTGLNGAIVACAPRYVTYVTATLNQRDPVGTCFVAKNARITSSSEVLEFSPCRHWFRNSDEAGHGQRNTGTCQAGFSAAISKDGQRLFVGAPGTWYWQGQLYAQGLDKPVLISTPESSPKYDDSYMGYSVAVGDFAGKGIQGVAVGVPRGAELCGMVVIYTWDLQNIKNITGRHIGAYFGYSLSSGDIDGDGRDDLIIGAPMYTKAKSDGYEHGRVYIVYQGKEGTFNNFTYRTGEISKGRFGLAVTSLGDINLDGFGDLAVGAPYAGVNGRGVVYIYLGGVKGVREKYSQAITAEEMDPMMTTFGFSLSGGVDLDNNQYTDLAVGAYKSDSVVFLRSRPVVKITAEVAFHGFTKVISLEKKKCHRKNGTAVGCAKYMFCLSYKGINVDQKIKLEVTLDLDSKLKTNKRLYLEGYGTTVKTNVLLSQDSDYCKEFVVYLEDDIRDKLTPLEIAMTYDLITEQTSGTIYPVLDQTVNNVYTDSVNIQKNCGTDNICIPDLQMAVTSPNYNYILGSNEKVNIIVKVANNGEDAFEAAYYLHIPAGVSYAKIKRLEEEGVEKTPVYCSILSMDPTANGNSTLKCDMGNPLASGKRVEFQIILEVEPSVSQLDFEMEVNSTNIELDTEYDNKRRLSIGVLVKAQLNILGTSDPPELYYNASNYDAHDVRIAAKLGPQVVHKYNIKNDGPFAVEEAELYIMWPYQTLSGENLMYMLVQPQFRGAMTCDVSDHVNPLGFFIENAYDDYLKKEWEAYERSEYSSWKQYEKGNNGLITGSASEREYKNTHTSGSQSGASYGQGRRYGEESYNQRKQERHYGEGGFNQGHSQEGSFRQGHSQGSYGSQGHSGNAMSQGHVANGVRREWNKTTVYDEYGNVVSESESSTEYSKLGHEGEPGSSFNRHAGGGTNRHIATTYKQGSNQNQYGGSQGGQERWIHGFDASSTNNDRKHSWSTEETVNRDLVNAGSTTYYGGAENSSGADGSGASVTVLDDGEETDDNSFGARAALNPNNEFRVGVADLGVLGSGSQGADYSAHGAQHSGYSGGAGSAYGSRNAGGAAHGSQSYGGGVQSGGAHGSSGNSYTYSHSSGSSQTGGQQYSYNARAHSGYNGADYARREATRRRRQIEIDPELKGMLEKCSEKYKCEVVRCVTGRLVKGQEIWVALRSRINSSVLNEISKDRSVKLSTLATARVTKLPMVGKPKEVEWKTAEAQTTITPQLEALTSEGIPLWVIILAAVVGALLLLLLILALYKCGFFKRNRPSDHAERQPLNGRDEHL